MKFYLKRLITLIITLLFVAFFTFLAFQVIPGDGALSRLGIEADETAVQALREQLGLNLSFGERFLQFLSGAVKGDFGISIQYSIPVTELIQNRLPVTIWLAGLSILLILFISLPLGLLGFGKVNRKTGHIITFFTQVCMAIPSFFLGILISIIFGILLKWFVPGGYVGIEQKKEFLKYMIFPAIAAAIPKIAMTVKFLRSSVLRELKLDYVRTARSKGNSEFRILFCHILKNALIPVVTFMGIIISDVLAGSIVIEQVFNIPGMGRLLVTAISNRDYPVVQTVVLYIAVVVILINFIVDLLYQKIDPRVRLSEN